MVKKWLTEIWVIPNVLYVQLGSLHWKQLRYSICSIGRDENKSARVYRSHKHNTWLGGFVFEWSPGYEKAPNKMGAEFAHN